jgi:hypothetical protein
VRRDDSRTGLHEESAAGFGKHRQESENKNESGSMFFIVNKHRS